MSQLKTHFTTPEGTYILDSKSSLYPRNTSLGNGSKLTYVSLTDEAFEKEDHLRVAALRRAQWQEEADDVGELLSTCHQYETPIAEGSPESSKSSKTYRLSAFHRLRTLHNGSPDSEATVKSTKDGDIRTTDDPSPGETVATELLQEPTESKRKRSSSGKYIAGILGSASRKRSSSQPSDSNGRGGGEAMVTRTTSNTETKGLPNTSTTHNGGQSINTTSVTRTTDPTALHNKAKNGALVAPGCLIFTTHNIFQCYAYGRAQHTISHSDKLDTYATPTPATAHAAKRVPNTYDAEWLMGTESGEVGLKTLFRRKPVWFNKGGCINKTKVTYLRWIPGSSDLFIAAHADGMMYKYHKERLDPTTAMNWKEAGRNVFNGFAVMHPRKISNPITRWRVGKGSINAFQFSPDQQSVAIVSQDGCLRIVDVKADRLIVTLQSYFGALLCVSWSPDGKYIVTGGEDDLVSIWSVENKGLVARGEGHSSWVVAVAFDPWVCDEKNRVYRIGSVGLDLRLLLWDFSLPGLRIPRKKGASTLNTCTAIDIAIPVPPLPRNMAPTFEPICSRVVDVYPLTDILFRRTCIITTSQAGSVKLWTRPSFMLGEKDNCEVMSNGKNRDGMARATPDDVVGTLIRALDTTTDTDTQATTDDRTRVHSPDDSDSLKGCDGDPGWQKTCVADTPLQREGYESQASARASVHQQHSKGARPPEQAQKQPQPQHRQQANSQRSDIDIQQRNTQQPNTRGHEAGESQKTPSAGPQAHTHHTAFGSDDDDSASLDVDTHTHTDLTDTRVVHAQTSPAPARSQPSHSQTQTREQDQAWARVDTQGQINQGSSPSNPDSALPASAQPRSNARVAHGQVTETGVEDAQAECTRKEEGTASGSHHSESERGEEGQTSPISRHDSATAASEESDTMNTLARTATIEVLGRGRENKTSRHTDSFYKEDDHAIQEGVMEDDSRDSGCEDTTSLRPESQGGGSVKDSETSTCGKNGDAGLDGASANRLVSQEE